MIPKESAKFYGYLNHVALSKKSPYYHGSILGSTESDNSPLSKTKTYQKYWLPLDRMMGGLMSWHSHDGDK
jgi:hypothetical protein